MARLSKSNKYAILWLYSQGNNTENICKELGIPTKQIDKILSEQPQNKQSQPENKPIAKTSSKDFMIRHSQNNNNSVSIMTQQASMINDEARKNYPKKPGNSSYIHKIS